MGLVVCGISGRDTNATPCLHVDDAADRFGQDSTGSFVLGCGWICCCASGDVTVANSVMV